jgi:regulatory protein
VGGGVLLLARCDFADSAERQPLVVEAFLETGASLPTITLRQTQSLRATDSLPAGAARGAELELRVNDRTVAYREAAQKPGRYVSQTAASVPAQASWQLQARWRAETATAQGTTPPPIHLAEVCVDVPPAPVEAIRVDSLRRDSLDIPAEQTYIYPVDVSLRWPVPAAPSGGSNTAHWVRPRLNPDTTESDSRVVSFFLEPVDVRREDRFRRVDDWRTWAGVYAVPAEDSTAAVPRHRLAVTLTRGDTAFAAFARSRDDPERREPVSNVRGSIVSRWRSRRGGRSAERRSKAPRSKAPSPCPTAPFPFLSPCICFVPMSDPPSPGHITRLEPQVHNEDRVSIFLDDEFALGIHKDLVVKHQLSVGMKLSPDALRRLERDAQYIDAKQRALDYLAYKPRTEAEVRRTLRGTDALPNVIDDVVARLTELGYLDDEAYAHDYAHNRFSSKQYGPVRIRRELKERGVDRHVADAAVDQLFAEVDARAAAWSHAEKRWPRLDDEDDPRRRRQKMYRYLRRRGFASDTIRSILDELERSGVRTRR